MQPSGDTETDRRDALEMPSGGLDESVQVFTGNGRMAVDVSVLVALAASDEFAPTSFIERHMGKLSGSGFEAARQELEKVMGYVSNQV